MIVFTADYNDGKVHAKAGDRVPASIPAHRVAVMLKAGLVKKAAPKVKPSVEVADK